MLGMIANSQLTVDESCVAFLKQSNHLVRRKLGLLRGGQHCLNKRYWRCAPLLRATARERNRQKQTGNHFLYFHYTLLCCDQSSSQYRLCASDRAIAERVNRSRHSSYRYALCPAGSIHGHSCIGIHESRACAPVVPQNVVRPRDMSRDDREGDPADRARTLTCVADGSTSAN